MNIQTNMKSKPHPVGAASSEIFVSSAYCFFFCDGIIGSLCLPLLGSPIPPTRTSRKIELDSKKIRRKTSENKEKRKTKKLFLFC